MEMADALLKPVEEIACDQCGHFGALEIADRRLCPDCIATAGCGCSGSSSTTED
jgi:hypothetical protein